MHEIRACNRRVRGAALAAALVGAACAVSATTGVARASDSPSPLTPRAIVVGYRAGTTGPSDAASRRPAPLMRSRVVRLSAGDSLGAALGRLRRRRDVAYAQPDYVAEAAGAPFYPDDSGRSHRDHGWEQMQWNMLAGTGIDAPQAWSNLIADGRAGGQGVTVAVLDTGVAYRDWGRFRESPDLHDTHFVDPEDVIDRNRFPLDRDGHGTFVASVIGESTNNGFGLTGLAYGASIMPVRVLGSDGLGDESTIATGIRYAVAHHAQIINLSLEFVPEQVHSASQIPLIVSAIADARRHGVMVVAAAGNDQATELAFPARLPGVVAVGATTRDGCLASYSNVGKGLALVAPGGGSDAIMPTDPACHPARDLPPIYQMTLSDPPHYSDFGYPGFYVGTSMAVPEVSGAAAMVIASGVIGPHPTSSEVLARLEQTATPLPAGARQPNTTYGWGLLDVGAATSPTAVGGPTDPLLPRELLPLR